MMQAQLVIDRNKSRLGVAIRGGRFVCALPEDWRAIACEKIRLEVINERSIIATHPDRAPLVLDPETGIVRAL